MEYIVVYPRRRFYFITWFARLTKLPQFRGVPAATEPLCFVALQLNLLQPPATPSSTLFALLARCRSFDDFLSRIPEHVPKRKIFSPRSHVSIPGLPIECSLITVIIANTTRDVGGAMRHGPRTHILTVNMRITVPIFTVKHVHADGFAWQRVRLEKEIDLSRDFAEK